MTADQILAIAAIATPVFIFLGVLVTRKDIGGVKKLVNGTVDARIKAAEDAAFSRGILKEKESQQAAFDQQKKLDDAVKAAIDSISKVTTDQQKRLDDAVKAAADQQKKIDDAVKAAADIEVKLKNK